MIILRKKLINFICHIRNSFKLSYTLNIKRMSNENATNAVEEIPFTSQVLKFEDASTGKRRQISYYKVDGLSCPGVLFIPGFMAIKNHKKSLEILKFCKDNDISCVSYDTAGYGESTEELKRTEARFSHWIQDAREVLLRLTDGPQVVIGSSMGGWLGMILAQEFPDKFSGYLLLAPAYNFGESVLHDVIEQIPSEIQSRMREGFVLERVDSKFPEYGPVPLSFELYEGMIPYNVPLEKNSIKIDVPVRILHGTADEIIPVSKSVSLIEAISSSDVTLLILKGCKHELSDPVGLPAIFTAVKELRKLSNLS